MTKDTRELALRTILLPKDTNAYGTIFGGVILSYIDIAGAVPAKRISPNRTYVTIAMNEVVFHEPVFVGDLISFYASVKQVGTSSITVSVDVLVERKDQPGSSVQVTSADVTYVAVDENRRPVSIS